MFIFGLSLGPNTAFVSPGFGLDFSLSESTMEYLKTSGVYPGSVPGLELIPSLGT